jgi:hypothetical protein
MEITFRNNFWDVFEFNLYLLPRATTYRFVWVFVIVAFSYIGFSTASSPEFTTPLERVLSFVIAVGGGVILLVLVIPVFLAICSLLMIRDQPKECKLTTISDGIKAESPTSRSEIKWAGIRKIEKTDNHIYLFVSDISAIVVPKRAFPQPEGLRQFYHSITALWKSGKSA